MIHRDLKPENIMVGGFGQVYVMDWGLARLTKTTPASGSRAQMEAPGAVGTPAYMAPEQARGNPADMDERSDVFGLGAMLYEIVSGKPPYGSEQDADLILERAKAGKVIPIDTACAGIGVSKRLRSIVEKAVAVQPSARYQTVMQLESDVHGFLRGGLHLPRKAFNPGEVIVREGEAGRRGLHDRERPLPGVPKCRRSGGDARGDERRATYSVRWRCFSTSRVRRASRPWIGSRCWCSTSRP